MIKALSFCRSKEQCVDVALLILRIAVGVIFILHGYGKLFGNDPGMTAFTGMVAHMGFPVPSLFAYAAAFAEFFGGIAVLLGIYTDVAAILIAIVMLVALVGVKKFSLPMADPDLALFAITLALYLMGPGKYTVVKKGVGSSA